MPPWPGRRALGAQLRAPRAGLAATVETAKVQAGKPATLVLTVTLPPSIHVQSNKPRDAAFFPTALVLTPPAGVTVTATKYPPAVDFRQEGQPEPLAVFEKTLHRHRDAGDCGVGQAGRADRARPFRLPGLRRQGLLPPCEDRRDVDADGRALTFALIALDAP